MCQVANRVEAGRRRLLWSNLVCSTQHKLALELDGEIFSKTTSCRFKGVKILNIVRNFAIRDDW